MNDCNHCRNESHDGKCKPFDMKEVRLKIREEFEGAVTEIGANKTYGGDAYNLGWNAGADMAMNFVRRYIAGRGLFQDWEKEESK